VSYCIFSFDFSFSYFLVVRIVNSDKGSNPFLILNFNFQSLTFFHIDILNRIIWITHCS